MEASAKAYDPNAPEILEVRQAPEVLAVQVVQNGLYHPFRPCLLYVRDVQFSPMDLKIETM